MAAEKNVKFGKESNKEILEKIEKVLEQNKIIAQGVSEKYLKKELTA